MHLLNSIRRGDAASCYVPRSQWAKLWNWCKSRSEDGAIRVTELVGINYEPRTIERKRMGSAMPRIVIQSTWDTDLNAYRIYSSYVSWSFVR